VAVGFEPTGTVSSHSVFDALGYAWGQCTAFVAESVSWLNGAQGLGNAKDWLSNAANQGYTIVSKPVVGAVAVFGGATPGSGGEGHVGVVTSVSGSNFGLEEANVVGLDSVDTGQYTVSNPNLLGFILPKGDTSGASPGISATLTSAGYGALGTPENNGQGYAGPANSGIDLNPLDWIGDIAGLIGGIVLRMVIAVLAVIFIIEGLKLIGSSSGHEINITDVLPSGKATGGATEGIAADAGDAAAVAA
jgi:surface antigen